MRVLSVCSMALLAVACRTGRAPADSPSARAPGGSLSATSATSLTDAQWNDRGVARVEDLMRGRFPGVRVLERDGGVEGQIRGATTFSGRTAPLYVIDGFPIETGPDGLLMLNPSDIKRIEVLKDEVSLTRYGVRAGNGVVVITTKQP